MNVVLRQLKTRFLELLPLRILKFRASGLLYESHVQVKSPDRLKLGCNVLIQRDSILHCGGRKWCNFGGKIVLEDNVVIGPKCVVYGAGEVYLGAYTHLGPGVMILSQSGLPTDRRLSANPDILFEPVNIGKGCWIGAGAVILGNTVLGDNCTVGPNSVVKGHYPANTVLIGNPARVSATTESRSRQ